MHYVPATEVSEYERVKQDLALILSCWIYGEGN